jgi:hypothetical protein
LKSLQPNALFFIEEECGDDENLRREIESLLSFEQTTEKFLDHPPASLAAGIFSESSDGKYRSATLFFEYGLVA